jgi:hypothetical protein
MEGRITTPPTMSGVPKRKAGQSRRHIEAKQSETIYLLSTTPTKQSSGKVSCQSCANNTTFRTTTPPRPPACCSSRKVWGLIPTAAQDEQRKVCQAKPNEDLSSRYGQHRVLLQSRYPPRQCLGRERAFVTQKEIPRIRRKLHLA